MCAGCCSNSAAPHRTEQLALKQRWLVERQAKKCLVPPLNEWSTALADWTHLCNSYHDLQLHNSFHDMQVAHEHNVYVSTGGWMEYVLTQVCTQLALPTLIHCGQP